MDQLRERKVKINSNSKVKTMSSREIAKLTGKRHDHVIRDIENILKDAEIEFEKRQRPISVPKDLSPTSYIKALTFIQQTFEERGLKENQLLLATKRGATKLTGFDLLASSEVTYLPSLSNDEYITPNQIGEMLNPVMGAKSLNEWLNSLGLLIPKHTRKGYVPTPEGEELGGRMMDTALKHTDGATQYLKWNASIIVPYLQNLIDTKKAERFEDEGGKDNGSTKRKRPKHQ